MAADLTVLHVVRAPYRRFAPLARPLLRIIVMLKKIGRLFIIKTRFEACLIIYALAMGSMARGTAYLHEYPGLGGKLLMAACSGRSEEHTSELQSLMRISYAVFCLKKKNREKKNNHVNHKRL